jgi:hypothetical protein
MVPVRFYTQARRTSGALVLRAVLSSDTTVRDTGYTGLFVLGTPEVTPDTTTSRGLNTSVTNSFKVKNPTTTSRTYNFTATCTWEGAPITCTRSPTSATVAAGATKAVMVSYTTGAALGQAGRILLKAVRSNNALYFDSSIVTATTRAKPEFAPSGGVAPGVAPNVPGSVTFVVRHSGKGPLTYNFTATCTGAAIPSATCTPTPASALVAPGKEVAVTVSFATGAAKTTGQVRLMGQLAGFALRGSVTLGIATKSIAVAVSPRGAARVA